MFAQIYEHRSSLPIKIYIGAFILALVVYFPIQAIKSTFKLLENQKQFISKLSKGPVQHSQFPISQLFSIMNYTTYSGFWGESLKQSRILSQEEGKIQIRTITNKEHGKKDQLLLLKIYDGLYQEDGYYQVQIECDSLKTEQKFSENKIVYQTIEPVIGQYKKKSVFSKTQSTRIFINKLKFRALLNQSLKIEVLLAGEYDINIITKPLRKNPHFFNALFLAIILLIQILTQIAGVLQLYQQIKIKGLIKKGLSPKTILGTMCWDISEIIVLLQISYIDNINLAVFILPLGLLIIMVFILQFKLLSTLLQDNHIQQQNQCWKYYFLIFGLLIFYISNLNWFIFVLFSALIMLPQIILNFKLGLKIKYQLTSLLKLVLPRFLILFYIRVFNNNMFHLKPDYLLCIGCFIFLSIQVGFLLVQEKFGSRSILPKFLIPQNFNTFRFFMNEEENNAFQCSICLGSLRDVPQSSPISEQVVYNKVVVTPCKHKFHFTCLQQWMQTKHQCPNCRRLLPPIDQE